MEQEKRVPTYEEMKEIVLDMPALDYLMAKWFHMYRIADTLTWIKFPPQDDILADLQKNTIMIMNLEYLWDDCVSKWQIQEAMKDEDAFHKQMSLLMGNIGTKSYVRGAICTPYAAADISNSMFAQKRLEECKKWQELGMEMAKNDENYKP
jgi:hypothetical protein